MQSESKKILIQQRRKEITKRYGASPIIYSSGKNINIEQEFPKGMIINLNSKYLSNIL